MYQCHNKYLIHKYCHKYHLKHNNSLDFIHYYFDGGFHENTEITLHNGVKKSIKDIEPDDVLEGDNEVIANVEIKSDDPNDNSSFDYWNRSSLKIGAGLFAFDLSIFLSSTQTGIKAFEGQNIFTIGGNFIYSIPRS